MQVFEGRFISTLLVVLCLLSAQQVRAEVVATTGATKIVYLSPLRNGLSAITLVWAIDRPTKDRVTALKAGLSSVVSGGTSSRSSYEIDEFRRSKEIIQNISTSGRNLLLTVSAPDDVFPEPLIHLENLLLETVYSRASMQGNSKITSSRTRVILGGHQMFLTKSLIFLHLNPMMPQPLEAMVNFVLAATVRQS